MPGVDPSATRSSSFWASLGTQFLQVAEYTLPQLGTAASNALAQRYGGNAPDVSVAAPEDQPGVADNTNNFLLWGGAILIGLIVIFAIAKPQR